MSLDRAPETREYRQDASLLGLLTPVVRRWRLMVTVPFAFAVIAAAYSLLTPSIYTASTTFTPEASGGQSLAATLGSLSSLTGQFGLAPTIGANASPDFFASVLRSRELLVSTLHTEFRDPATGTPRRLLDLLEIHAPNDAQALALGVTRLGEVTSTAVDRRTGIVTLSTRLRDPKLGADVANRMVQLLNDFNLRQRQSQSREQKRFAADRLAQAEGELRQAEQVLQRFLERNRTYRGSPLLEFEHDRLARLVELKQQVYVALSKSLEDARIAEVRDTPVLTIIDPATPPARRSSPKRRLLVLIAALAGIVVAGALAHLAELRANLERTDAPEYRALLEASAQLPRPWRRAGRA